MSLYIHRTYFINILSTVIGKFYLSDFKLDVIVPNLLMLIVLTDFFKFHI